MKCQKCRDKAVIKIARANAKYCAACFNAFFVSQVRRGLEREKMASRSDKILIAVSGGKDSLALWHVLSRLGYETAGLHIDLGIGEYSESSRRYVDLFAEKENLEVYSYSLKEAYKMGILELAGDTDRSPCSACGTVKRYLFNKVASDKGFPVLATGHNLDDEAARLLGNLLRWQDAYLEKQSPVLESEEGFVKKIKPLYRLSEQETAAYAFLNGISYVVEECPMSVDAPMLVYKKALNLIEHQSPGTKHQFYLEFLEKRKKEPDRFLPKDKKDGRVCQECGQPTTSQICGFCKLMNKPSFTGRSAAS